MSETCELAKVLMERDSLTLAQAMEQINDMRSLVAAGEDPEEVLLENAGLEPDYIFDIIP